MYNPNDPNGFHASFEQLINHLNMLDEVPFETTLEIICTSVENQMYEEPNEEIKELGWKVVESLCGDSPYAIED